MIKTCEFGCGPTGDEHVSPGVGIVPACPVHGWMCELIDSANASAVEAAAGGAEAVRLVGKKLAEMHASYAACQEANVTFAALVQDKYAEIGALKRAIKRALDEFPVPDEGLPMPQVIAHQILVAALKSEEAPVTVDARELETDMNKLLDMIERDSLGRLASVESGGEVDVWFVTLRALIGDQHRALLAASGEREALEDAEAVLRDIERWVATPSDQTTAERKATELIHDYFVAHRK